MAKLTAKARNKLCAVHDCERPHIAKGLCKLHYYRVRRSGHPDLQSPLDLPDWASEADIAWAAGFIDADGSILIERSSKIYRGERHVSHSPRICACGIDRSALEYMQSIFGGQIVRQRRYASSAVTSRFPVWQWSITHYRAIHVARLLMPYLRIKSVQAYLLSCFDYEALWSKGGDDPKMPRAEFDRREALVAEMREWNGRAYLEAA